VECLFGGDGGLLEDFPEAGGHFLVVFFVVEVGFDLNYVSEADGEVLLEIMER